jgi:puromycin-sensitive aminopeptidase
MTKPSSFSHLLDSFIPSTYAVALDIRQSTKFSGSVTITGQPTSQQVETITLHSKNLEITAATINGLPGTVEHAEHDQLHISIKQKIGKQATVQIQFTGHITDTLVGIYPARYSENGQEELILTTQLESHHAREVFPCIDEPAAKAVFTLELQTQPDIQVLSNTEIDRQNVIDERLVTTFQPTPKMSTYLLAFVAGRLEAREGRTKNGTLTRVWTTPQHAEHSAFALDVAIASLEKLEEFFDEPFPLPKCDHVGLPDFAAGAMENWGLITYREAALILDPANSSTDDRQYAAGVIAHELAHQWFGNLVTMQWWTDLWLNEGFARWMETYIPDLLFPEWQLWDQFVASDYLNAQSLDALRSSHPVEVTVDDPEEIRSIFDAISYDKGASVIRMVHDYLGDADFQKGLQHYINQHKYQNTTTNDLWQALEDSSGKPVRSFMAAWTTQTGYPVVTVQKDDSGLTLAQSRFAINQRQPLPDNPVWPIPISTTNGGDTFMLDQPTAKWETSLVPPAKLNPGQSGFYVTSYDEGLFAELSSAIQSRELPALDRLGVINERFQLAKAGQVETVSALKLLDQFSSEENAMVWEVAIGHLMSLRRVMGSDELRDAMRPFLATLVSQQLERLGWKQLANESHFDTLLRPLILAQASLAEVDQVVDRALKQFSTMTSLQAIEPDLRPIILGTAARHGDQATFDTLLQLYRKHGSPQIKLQILGALTNFKQDDIIDQSINLIDSPDVKLQDVAYWIAYHFANRYAKTQTWQWFVDHWGWIEEKFGSDIMTISYFPKMVGRAFADKDFESTYQEFFDSLTISGLQMPIAQGLETLQWQADWKSRDEAAVLQYFKGLSS